MHDGERGRGEGREKCGVQEIEVFSFGILTFGARASEEYSNMGDETGDDGNDWTRRRT